MSYRIKLVGVILGLMSMSFFLGWPVWKWLDKRAASEMVRARVQAIAESNPALQTAWEVALLDDVLSFPEAKVIVEAGGEKLELEK